MSRTILAEFSPVDRFYKDKKGSCLGQFASFFSGKPLQIFVHVQGKHENPACLDPVCIVIFAFLGDQALFRRCESQRQNVVPSVPLFPNLRR